MGRNQGFDGLSQATFTREFLQDLASCRGIIATAGFSLISECLYFRKKMLLLPVRGQYEQMVNAWHAERLGLALNRTSLNAPTLAEYLDTLDQRIVDRDDVLWPDNRTFFRVLNQTFKAVYPKCDGVSPRILPAGSFVAG